MLHSLTFILHSLNLLSRNEILIYMQGHCSGHSDRQWIHWIVELRACVNCEVRKCEVVNCEVECEVGCDWLAIPDSITSSD